MLVWLCEMIKKKLSALNSQGIQIIFILEFHVLNMTFKTNGAQMYYNNCSIVEKLRKHELQMKG